MRFHITVLVLAVIFLSCATSPVATKPEMVVHKTHSFVSGQHSILTKRVLRAQNTANENDGERVNIGIDKVMALLKAVEHLVDSPKAIWNKLQLGAGVEKVVQNPNLKLLDEYVNMFNKKYPEQQMSLLIFRYNDEALAMRSWQRDTSKLQRILRRSRSNSNWKCGGRVDFRR
ncbi:RxLR effector protein [Phytophthora megakarya]|uniref:RxLR effector protein n=1 Tax=Phytophthora megakarya TaxID=4795 RepID=A0A225VJQ8_9STRA|nr:RxLR effector protein [Phytophthora megakarya]